MASRTEELWTVVIDRPLDDVFAFVARIGSEADWSPRLYRAEDATDGPFGVGTRWTSYGRVPGNDNNRNEVEVVEFEEPSRFVLNCTDVDKLYIHEFTFAAMGSTTTTVNRRIDFPKPGGLAGRAYPTVMKTIVRPGVQKGMDLLKTHLESQ
jgi:hypothetical protein